MRETISQSYFFNSLNALDCERTRSSGTTKIAHPWDALLKVHTRAEGSYMCGGSLINNRFVITAAHCLHHNEVTAINVRLGEWRRSTNPDCIVKNHTTYCADPYVEVAAETLTNHPHYNRLTKQNDIALIRLSRTISYTDYISPVCLPIIPELRRYYFENINMTVAGWGVDDTEKATDIKMTMDTHGWNPNKCRKTLSNSGVSFSEAMHICAGGVQGFGVCSGDSGGVLVKREIMDNREVYVAYGVVSFSFKCAAKDLPDVYTNVSNYIDWIQLLVSQYYQFYAYGFT